MLFQLIANHPASLLDILRHTPLWVGGVFIALVASGTSQLRERQAPVARALGLPAVLALLSLAAVLGTFGDAARLPSLAAWFAAAAAGWAVARRGHSGSRYDPAARRFVLAGSAVPLVLMLSIFVVRYAVNVELALAPRHLHETGFVLAVAALYGGFAGVFAGRATRLLRLLPARTAALAA